MYVYILSLGRVATIILKLQIDFKKNNLKLLFWAHRTGKIYPLENILLINLEI